MKIYWITYNVNGGEGVLEAFSSRREAEKRKNEIIREQRQYDKDHPEMPISYDEPQSPYDQLPDTIYEKEFPISKSGIIAAFNFGADMVPK